MNTAETQENREKSNEIGRQARVELRKKISEGNRTAERQAEETWR